MAATRKKLKNKQIYQALAVAAASMLLILVAVFISMNGKEPSVPPAPEAEPGLNVPPNVYGPDDFARDKQGFLQCLTGPCSTGIDVSSNQPEVDWEKVKAAGVEFVFIRVGSRGSTEGALFQDTLAQTHYEGAKAAGLQIGAYFYSQAISVEEAEEEAAFTLAQIADWELDLPVVYDWEQAEGKSRTSGMTGRELTACTLAFCEAIQAAELQPMIYFNKSQGLMMLDLDKLQIYPFWLAFYNDRMNFPYRVDYWQYTQTGTVDGIEGNVDVNLYLPS